MRLEQATQQDFDDIIAFYDDVTGRTPDMALYARWIKGKHPTQDFYFFEFMSKIV